MKGVNSIQFFFSLSELNSVPKNSSPGMLLTFDKFNYLKYLS